MSHKDFDQFIHGRLSEAQTPLNTEALWKSVDTGLHGAKASKGGWAWFTLLTLMLVGVAVFMGLVAGDSSAPGQGHPVQHTQEVNAQNLPAGNFDHERADNPARSMPQPQSFYHHVPTHHSEQHILAADMHTKPGHMSKQAVPNEFSENEFGTVHEAGLSTIQTSYAVGPPTPSIYHTTYEGKDSDEQAIGKSTDTPDHVAAHDNHKQPQPVMELPDFSDGAHYSDGSLQIPGKVINDTALMGLMPMRNPTPTWNAPQALTYLEAPFDQVDSKGTKYRYFTRFDVGLGFYSKTLENRNPSYTDLVNERKNAERPLEMVNAQLAFGIVLPNGIYLLSGFNYSRLNEHFTYVDHRSDIEDIPVLSHIHIDASGDSIFSYSTIQAVSTTSRSISHYNRITLIDVPLMVGKMWQSGRLLYGLEGGALVNIRLSGTGTTLNPAMDAVRIESGGVMNSSVGMSYAAQARFGIALSPKLNLECAPGLRIIPGNVLNDPELSQGYRLYHLNVGMRYNF